jgi:hypothetical protein
VLKSKDNSLQELARKTTIYIDRRILGHLYDNLFLKKIFIYKERGIIIKQTSVKELDAKDLEFVDALRSLNVPRNVAALIT